MGSTFSHPPPPNESRKPNSAKPRGPCGLRALRSLRGGRQLCGHRRQAEIFLRVAPSTRARVRVSLVLFEDTPCWWDSKGTPRGFLFLSLFLFCLGGRTSCSVGFQGETIRKTQTISVAGPHMSQEAPSPVVWFFFSWGFGGFGCLGCCFVDLQKWQ